MKVTIIGAGAMGGALAMGFYNVKANLSLEITLSDPSQSALENFAGTDIITTKDNCKAIQNADTIILAVKPWIVESVIKEIKDFVNYNRQIVISIAAGIKSENLIAWFDRSNNCFPALLIAIPNTAASKGCSMTFVVPVTSSVEQTNEAIELLSSIGKVTLLEEKQLLAATALSSCGIAYAMRYIRATMEAGVEIGFGAKTSLEIVLQTVKGAVELLSVSKKHPEEEIDRVTTAAGMTIRGLNEMERQGFTNAVISGVKAGLK